MPNKEQQPTNQNQELFRRMQMQKAAQESQSKARPTGQSSEKSGAGLIENLSNQVNEGVEKLAMGIFKFIPFLLTFAKSSVSNIGRPPESVLDDMAEGVITNWSKIKF